MNPPKECGRRKSERAFEHGRNVVFSTLDPPAGDRGQKRKLHKSSKEIVNLLISEVCVRKAKVRSAEKKRGEG